MVGTLTARQVQERTGCCCCLRRGVSLGVYSARRTPATSVLKNLPLFSARIGHVENEPPHLRGLIHLDEVSSTRHEKQLRRWQELMEAAGDARIQVRIGIAKDDPDRSSELSSLGSALVRDLTVDDRSSFNRKKAGRALGVASNC